MLPSSMTSESWRPIASEYFVNSNCVNIPLIKQLTKAVKKADIEAAKFVHLGATSQDVIDTATMLQVRDAFFILENVVEHLHQVFVV